MILKDIYIYPDLLEYDDDLTNSFSFQASCICMYVKRHLKKFKYQTERFNSICLIGTEKLKPDCIHATNVLSFNFLFDKDDYLELNKNELNPYFKQVMSNGLVECNKVYDIPLDDLLKILDDFEKNGFLNRWLHRKKFFKEVNLRCFLDCELTVDFFSLKLRIERDKEVVFHKEILNTLPDETIYHYQFKDIVFDEKSIFVIDKFGGVTFKVLVDDIL